MLGEMYNIRNAAGQYCTGHNYASYAAFQQTIGYHGDEESTGDYNRALDNMTYCTCESRFANACDCQQRTDHNWCQCDARNVYTCDCQSRSGGKYGPPPCNCNGRIASICGCRQRDVTVDCTCDGRCSCNAVKEFSMVPPNDACTCNGVFQTGCACQNRAATMCVTHSCACHNRSSVLVNGPCTCNARRYRYSYAYQYEERCQTNTCSCLSRSAVDPCQCNNRCACNTNNVIV